MKAEEIPDDAICPEERHAGGGWLRLDPTPSVENSEQVEERSVVDRVSKSFDYARWLWNDYVLRLTSGRQQAAILRPLALDQETPLAGLIDADAWRRLAQRAAGRDAPDDAPSDSRWFGGMRRGGGPRVAVRTVPAGAVRGAPAGPDGPHPPLAQRADRAAPSRSTSGWSRFWDGSACTADRARRSASSPARPLDSWPRRPTTRRRPRSPKPWSRPSTRSGSATGRSTRSTTRPSLRNWSSWNDSCPPACTSPRPSQGMVLPQAFRYDRVAG